MSLLRSLGNLLSGRSRHWNEHNSAHWRELWGRTELLPAPTGGILQSLLLGSWLFVDGLLGPKRTLDIGVDCRGLQREQFARLHAGFLEYSAALLVGSSPLLRESVLEALPLLTGVQPWDSRLLSAASAYAGDHRATSHVGLQHLQAEVHRTLGLAGSVDPLVARNVEVLATTSSSAALKGVKDVLQSWSLQDSPPE